MPLWLYWILLGLLAGSLAKFLVPGRDPSGCIITILLGIVGAFIGGVIAIQLACVGWVVGTSYARRHELGDDPFRSTALQMVFSGTMLLAAATWNGDWARLSREWTKRIDQRIAELQRLREGLTQCIGCGCLSIDRCSLSNPADRAGRAGPGPRYWLG